MAKKFSVNVHYDMVINVDDIIAENEQEAMKIAESMTESMDLNTKAECYGVESCIVSEEDSD